MSNNAVVPVLQAQQVEFKQLSKKFFELIEAGIETKTPKRKGLNIFSQSFGYTSHSHLCTLSKGFTTKHSLEKNIRNNFTGITEVLFPPVSGLLSPQLI